MAAAASVVRAQAPVDNPTGDLRLEDAIRLTLQQHPSLLAFDFGRRAAEARQIQAGRRPNPTLGALVEDLGAGGGTTAPVQVTAQLSHVVELGGKRAARIHAAEGRTAVARLDYEAARLDVVSTTAAAFRMVLAAQARLAHAELALTLARDVERTVGARVTAGVVSPIEETRARLLTAGAESDLTAARQALDAARRTLVLSWGVSSPMFDQALGDLAAMPAVPPFNVLAAGLDHTPDSARWIAEVERRQAELALARTARTPDLTVNAGYRRITSTGANAVIVGGTITLPWFDKNRDGIAAADADVARGRAEAEAARLVVLGLLSDAYTALQQALTDADTAQTRLVPGAREVYNTIREGYALGRFGLMDVLDAQRGLVTAERRLLDAQVAVHSAVSAVERLTGEPLPLRPITPGSRRP
jgi:cobalt-zinc-cadmium efflux system outer membrane protein